MKILVPSVSFPPDPIGYSKSQRRVDHRHRKYRDLYDYDRVFVPLSPLDLISSDLLLNPSRSHLRQFRKGNPTRCDPTETRRKSLSDGDHRGGRGGDHDGRRRVRTLVVRLVGVV